MADERFWDQLLPLLEEKRVIPVVGRDLLTIEVDGRPVDLYEHLARRLATRLELPGPAPATLNELACRYLADRRPLEEIYPALKRELGPLEQGALPEPLLKLAEIGWFKLYVSTTFDNLLWRAVNTVRYQGAPLAHSLAYALNNDFPDLPDELSSLQRPVVYQLLGRASAIQDTYAVTDEDLLEFVHNLQIKDRRPRRLFEALAANHLLFLGGRFSPWLIRFFLRAVKHPERLWQVRGKAGFVVDTMASQDAGFMEFLHHYSDRTLVYASGGPVDYVNELWDRWKQSRPDPSRPAGNGVEVPQVRTMRRHSVFLSYASEDRAIVEGIKSQLDAAGIDAWFDRTELELGQSWAKEIAANIDSAAAFVPIISSSVLHKGAREFRAEWERSLEAQRRRPRAADGNLARFIMPVVIDGTGMQTEGVRQYFGDMQAIELPGGQLTDGFRSTMRDLVRAAQLAG